MNFKGRHFSLYLFLSPIIIRADRANRLSLKRNFCVRLQFSADFEVIEQFFFFSSASPSFDHSLSRPSKEFFRPPALLGAPPPVDPLHPLDQRNFLIATFPPRQFISFGHVEIRFLYRVVLWHRPFLPLSSCTRWTSLPRNASLLMLVASRRSPPPFS